MFIYLFNLRLAICSFLALWLLTYSTSFAQVYFTDYYGGTMQEHMSKIRKTPDGGYVMVGSTGSYGPNTPSTFNDNLYVVKTTSDGTVEWSIAFGGSAYDFGRDIQVTRDGGYIVMGTTYSFGADPQAYLVKLNDAGQISWSKSYGQSNFIEGYCVLEKPDGHFLLAGAMDTVNYYGIWLAETDSSGNLLQSKWMNTNTDNYPGDIDTFPDGSVLLAGYTINSLGENRMFIYKMDNQLNLEWRQQQNYSTFNNERAYCIEVLPNSDFVIGGYSSSNEMSYYVYDYYIGRFDSSGNIIQQRTYGQPGIYEQAFDISFDAANNRFQLSGVAYDGLYYHALIITADSTLNLTAQAQHGLGSGSSEDFVIHSTLRNSDGSLVIGGITYEPGNGEMFLALLDSNGATLPSCLNFPLGPYTMHYPSVVWSPPYPWSAVPASTTQNSPSTQSATGVIQTNKCNTVGIQTQGVNDFTIRNDYLTGEIEITWPESVPVGHVTVYDLFGRLIKEAGVTSGKRAIRFGLNITGCYIAGLQSRDRNYYNKFFFVAKP